MKFRNFLIKISIPLLLCFSNFSFSDDSYLEGLRITKIGSDYYLKFKPKSPAHSFEINKTSNDGYSVTAQ